MRILMIAAALVAGVTAASAQEDLDERKFIEEQFKGWTGIVLRCVPNSSNKILTERICDSAAAEFSYLAENSNIPNVISRGENSFQAYMTASEIGTPLFLELETVTTTGQSGPIGVHVRISASRFYSKAVDLSETAGGPRLMPKGGTLLLWEDVLIAAGGDAQGMAGVIAPMVNDKVKMFFAQFLKGWKAK